MAKTFDEWTITDLTRALSDTSTRATNARTNTKLFEGEHWLGGEGWVGPFPVQLDAQGKVVAAEIEKAFSPVNMISEVVNRHRSAVIGLEPAWTFAPTRALEPDDAPNSDEQTLIKEAAAALTVWWDARGIHSLIQKATTQMLLTERAVLRLYVPQGLLDDDGQIPRGDLAQSLDMIYLDVPDSASADVVTDRNTQAEAGVLSIDLDDDDASGTYRELCFVVRDPQSDRYYTIIRSWLSSADDSKDTEPLDLGKRLTMFAMRREPFITAPLRSNQYQLNMHNTMMSRNGVLAGFVSRLFLNAELPEIFEVGGGTTNTVMGAPIIDPVTQELTGIATPQYIREEPVKPDTFIAAKDDCRRTIYSEVQQMHALISGDAVTSGESREQARADFETSLETTVTQVERALRWLLETTLAMAAQFSGNPGKYETLRAVVTLRTNTGPLSSEKQAQVRENRGAGLISTETAMSQLGVDDPDAELAAIAREREARADAATEQQQTPTQRTNGADVQASSTQNGRQAQEGSALALQEQR